MSGHPLVGMVLLYPIFHNSARGSVILLTRFFKKSTEILKSHPFPAQNRFLRGRLTPEFAQKVRECSCRFSARHARRWRLRRPAGVPGLIWGLGVIILATITAKKLGYRGEAKLTASIVLKTFWQAIPSLLMIVIVIGGILCGVFTATEGSAVAVVYATVLSLIYGSIKIKDIPRIVLESAKITGTITFMIGLSSIMSWAMAFTGIPDMVAAAVLGITSNKIIIFLLINIILLFVGTFMDPTPAILIFTPIFLPICTSLGMNAVQFGIVLCYNLSVGTITPPVGTILFTGCKVGGVTIESVISHLLPYFVMIIIGLLLVTYVPVLSLGLPSLLGLL